jgi:hypothetical protein
VAGERSNRVRVSGAKGRPPTPHYKVSCTYVIAIFASRIPRHLFLRYQEGYRLAAELFIAGEDARRKAAAVAESVIQKASFIIQRRNLPPLTATNVELLGTEFSTFCFLYDSAVLLTNLSPLQHSDLTLAPRALGKVLLTLSPPPLSLPACSLVLK